MPLLPNQTIIHRAAMLLLAASLFTGCAKSTSDEIAAAQQATAAKDGAAAMVHLKNAVSADPKHPKARFLLGQQYAAGGDPQSAVAEFKRALELKYPADELARPLADALLYSGQAAKVLTEIPPLPVKDPKAVGSVQTAMAQAHIALGNLPAASQSVDKAEAAAGATPETRLLRAQLAAARGNQDLALKLVDELVLDQPNDDKAWAFKGELHDRQPDGSAAALQAFGKAVSLNPNNFQALLATVAIQLVKKDTKAAQTSLDALRKAAPTAFMTQYYEGQLKVLEGNPTAARSAYQAALKQAPENPMLLLASAMNELKLKAYALAETQFGTVVRLQPSNVSARFYLARTFLAQGRPDQATATLAPLLDSAKPPAEVLLVAAEARLLQGDPKGAEQLFTKAGKLYPDSTSVRFAMALVNAAKGNIDAAIQELQRLSAASQDTLADIQLISLYSARQNHAAALAAIDVLAKKQPDAATSHDLQGQVLIKAGKKDEARRAFEEALKKDPQYLSAIANLADLDLMDGHPERAQERLEAQAKRDPANAGVRLALAAVAKRNGASPQAMLAEYEKAAKADPRNVRAQVLLIEQQLLLGDVVHALEAARAAVAAVPDNALIYEALARCLLRAGDSRQALTTYGKLVQLAPKAPAGYLGQAQLLLSMNDGIGANKAVGQLLAFDPSNLDAKRLQVAAALQQKQPDRALAVGRDLQRDQPMNPMGYAMQGEVHLAQRRFDQAAAMFQAAAGKPDGSAFVSSQFTALVGANRGDEARRVAAEAVRQHPKHLPLLRQLGGAAYDAGDKDLARGFYEKALEVAPKDAATLNNLAWILVEAKDPNALAMAERAAAEAPSNPDVLDTLAEAWVLNDQRDKAIVVLRNAIQRSTAPARLSLRLAQLYVETNDRERARVELEALRDLGKAFPNQAEVRKLMARIR